MVKERRDCSVSPTPDQAFPPGKYDDTHPNIAYDRYWAFKMNSGTANAYKGTLHISSGIGHELSFRLTGQRFHLGYQRGRSFGTVTVLIDDQTYFVIDGVSNIVACGGWSKRRTLFGGDQTKTGPDPLLDPATESARIRAFFVHPSMARHGLGRQLMAACIDASKQAAAGDRSKI